jgi:predicted RecA/RadA family phage recombinase
MKNFIQPGDTLDLIAPTGGVVSGEGYLIGSIFAVAFATKAATETFAGKVEGVFEMDKLTTDVVAAGDKLNWNDTNKEWQKATSDLDNAATAVEAAGNGVTSLKVRLTPV